MGYSRVARRGPIRHAKMVKTRRLLLAAALAACVLRCATALVLRAPDGQPWKRHTIDAGLHGSDGTKLADVDGDGLPDIVGSWENEGVTRVYRNPGFRDARSPWPNVTIGATPTAEDAVFADVDLDGALDVVSMQEKNSERVQVFWGPTDRSAVFDPAAWTSSQFTAVSGVSMWMFAQPIRLRPDRPIDLVIGGKNYDRNQSTWLGLLLAPAANRRDASAWTWRPLARVSWVMSIEVLDMNGDGFDDILFSDKNGPATGVWWLENPGASAAQTGDWKLHPMTESGLDGAMFVAVGDLDGDGLSDVIGLVDHVRPPGATDPGDNAHRRILFIRRLDASGLRWETHEILVPPHTGQPKAVAIGDVNGDGRNDLVVTCSGAVGDLIGTYWLEGTGSTSQPIWRAHDIAGPAGIKFDLVHLIDLDGDGDLDVLTSEEKEGGDHLGLGIFWYENPR
jgi:VCBS repeat protein